MRLDHITPSRLIDRHTAGYASQSSETYRVGMIYAFSPDDHSVRAPPDPMPNSAVKPLSADGSVGSPHARVGHRQALIVKTPRTQRARGVFYPGFRKYGCIMGRVTSLVILKSGKVGIAQLRRKA